MRKIIYALILSGALFACSNNKNQETSYEFSEKNGCLLHSFRNEAPHKVENITFPQTGEVRNVILMIGDGMGLNVVQAASIANNGELYINNANYVGQMKTTAQDSIITDSAAAGTAMATGIKTKRGYVGVDAQGNSLKTICEYAKDAGLSTGVMSTCRIYDATPATFAVENLNRNAYDSIVASYLSCNIDFILGGGRDHFTTRKDGKDLLSLLGEKGYEVITSIDSLSAIKTEKIFAIVAEHDMPVAIERGEALWKSTEKALEVLSGNDKGFFLMVESAMIDDFGHRNDLSSMMEETLDFDRTIGKTLKWAEAHPGTLVIVTADHSTGGLTITEGNLEKGKIKGYFSTGHHDGVIVPVYAFGVGSNDFTGVYDNTELFGKIKNRLRLKD